MNCLADVNNLKCHIVDNIIEEIQVEMYGVDCVVDTDNARLSRVYNWLYNSGCSLNKRQICRIEQYSKSLDLRENICEENQVKECDETINCGLISVGDKTTEDCTLPISKTITILK